MKKEFGFIRVAAAIPEIKVADCSYNCNQIKELLYQAETEQVEIVCFPELSVTGYTCADLFFQQTLLREAEAEVASLLEATKTLNCIYILGVPIAVDEKIVNTAIVCWKGEIMGAVPKSAIPNYGEFYEKRWFVSANDLEYMELNYANSFFALYRNQLFETGKGKFAIEICEDLWSVIPPSSQHALQGATLLFNLSASNALIGKTDYLANLVSHQSARCLSAYVYCSCGAGESTTDVVYASNAQIYENGAELAVSERYHLGSQLIVSEVDLERLQAERRHNTTFIKEPSLEEYIVVSIPLQQKETELIARSVYPFPLVPQTDDMDKSCNEIVSIQAAGLIKRLRHTQAKHLVVGISGGLDSTLALLIAVRAFDALGWERKRIVGVTMPGFGTTGRTYQNAISLMSYLGVTSKEISIKASVYQHFKDIGHDAELQDVTYENCQARERTQILMDLANQMQGFVLGTGDLSELALGWATYNGDHMSMYAVNASIPKTLVRYLVKWVALQMESDTKTVLLDIIDTPVSPELLPADHNGEIKQKTEDLVGPYELHDFYLFYMMRYGFTPAKIFYLAQKAFAEKYSDETLLKWLRKFYWRFFSQQFKRSCMPDGPKVGSVNLSPRGDWRMPSDAVATLWLKEVDALALN